MVTSATHTKRAGQKKSSGSGMRVNGFPAENELRDLQFKLQHSLQSTLEVENTLELFFNNITDAFTVEGMQFRNDNGIELYQGTRKRHRVQYAVSSDQASLGQIEFSRSKPFLETELALLEMLLGVLFYPLRNALMYREALASSMRDALTGIGNRSAMDACFSREIKLAQRHQLPLSLLLVDADHFKSLNDNYGHRAGDKVLQKIARGIQSTLRETDQIFRYGGEEFVVLLNNTDGEDARLIAERIRVHIAINPVVVESQEISVTISAGVTALTQDDTAGDFFERADRALYAAKRAGRNRVITQLPEAPLKETAPRRSKRATGTADRRG